MSEDEVRKNLDAVANESIVAVGMFVLKNGDGVQFVKGDVGLLIQLICEQIVTIAQKTDIEVTEIGKLLNDKMKDVLEWREGGKVCE